MGASRGHGIGVSPRNARGVRVLDDPTLIPREIVGRSTWSAKEGHLVIEIAVAPRPDIDPDGPFAPGHHFDRESGDAQGISARPPANPEPSGSVRSIGEDEWDGHRPLRDHLAERLAEGVRLKPDTT